MSIKFSDSLPTSCWYISLKTKIISLKWHQRKSLWFSKVMSPLGTMNESCDPSNNCWNIPACGRQTDFAMYGANSSVAENETKCSLDNYLLSSQSEIQKK